jgi:hypothetical protein
MPLKERDILKTQHLAHTIQDIILNKRGKKKGENSKEGEEEETERGR